MSDLRFDPVSQQWVAIARNRNSRPVEFMPQEHVRQHLMCPFCKGNEDETPTACASYRGDGSRLDAVENSPHWTVRVVPNKYPAFDSSPNKKPVTPQADIAKGPYQSAYLQGEQELIIGSPRHVSSLSELNDQELFVSFLACQDRIRYQQTLEHVQHSMLFLNCRCSAGASLSHIHTQLIGAPVTSERLQSRSQRNQDHVAEHGISVIQSLVDWEREQQARIIFESDHFTVFCPFASRFPYQTWIVPKFHQQRFTDCPTDMRNELASICRHLVGRMEYLLEQPGYNLLLHQAPFSFAEHDHWYFELLPRLTRVAGFEWGTDIWVNPVAPESAAKRLRLE